MQIGYPSRAEVKILGIFLLLGFTAIELAARPAVAETDDWAELERQLAEEQRASCSCSTGRRKPRHTITRTAC